MEGSWKASNSVAEGGPRDRAMSAQYRDPGRPPPKIPRIAFDDHPKPCFAEEALTTELAEPSQPCQLCPATAILGRHELPCAIPTDPFGPVSGELDARASVSNFISIFKALLVAGVAHKRRR